MPKITEQQYRQREEEIVTACAKLYETVSFKEITIKEIGSTTSFTRTSIYNYFNTKEEIFLALLEREYDRWVKSMYEQMSAVDNMNALRFAEILASTLSERTIMLKILAMNLYDIEENSRVEKLASFKRVYAKALTAVENGLKRIPGMNNEEREAFIYSFFPFIFGIYPYAHVTDKQKAAMDSVGLKYKNMSVYEVALCGAKRLLGFQ